MRRTEFQKLVLAELGEIKRRITGENIQGEIIMSQLEDLTTALNNETNTLAAKLTALQASLANVASPADLAALQAVSDRLTALGADSSNPIPAPVPPAPTTPAA